MTPGEGGTVKTSSQAIIDYPGERIDLGRCPGARKTGTT
jgi:hypothetical protein